MASLVNGIELLDKFGAYRVIFPFFLILAITYGILSQTKFFGDNKNVNIIISMAVAFTFVLSSKAVAFINILIPFIVGFLMILFLIMLVTGSTGVSLGEMTKGINKGGWFIIVLIIIIIFFLVMNLTFPEFNPETREAGNASEAYEIVGGITDMFFSPVVVGLIVLFAVFAAAAYVITVKN